MSKFFNTHTRDVRLLLPHDVLSDHEKFFLLLIAMIQLREPCFSQELHQGFYKKRNTIQRLQFLLELLSALS